MIQSPRGTELGEVLAPAAGSPVPDPVASRVLRDAGPDDLELARRVELDRPARLAACESVLSDGIWPLDLIDVEPLLDDRRTVIHYLGPHHLDGAGLLESLRRSLNLDVLLQPAGRDEPAPVEDEGGCGSCGSSGGGCGPGGGCGDAADGGGCSGCAVKNLVRRASR